jgi:ketosteroid isomerase-like protein
MRRTSLITILVFVAGLGIGYFARGAVGTLQQRYTHKADLAAIEKLNQEDIEATLTQDPKRLIDEWAEDAVRFTPGSPPVVGKQAIGAENEKFHAQFPGFKVLSYTSKYNGLQVEDGLACEGFEKKGEYRLSPESPPASWHASGLLVLKRQSDGSWKGVMAFPISWDEFPSGGNVKRQ